MRVTVIDAENGRMMIDKRYRRLVQLAELRGRPIGAGMLRIIDRPDGLDLLQVDDAKWLQDRVTAAKPDLVVMGPAYRFYTGNVNEEPVARAFVTVLDRIRTVNRCAMIIEAHAGHGGGSGTARDSVDKIRPRGSSLFIGWTPFGYALRTISDENLGLVELVPWRGPRDERQWPERLRHGGDNNWPWVEDVPDEWRRSA